MDDFLRTHKVNIWNLKFRKSRCFRFKNQNARKIFTNKLIIEYEPSVYRRFEDEYNREVLKIKVSWSIAVFTLSFLLVLPAFLFLTNPYVSFSVMGISIVLFLTAVYLKRKYIQFAYNIDFVRTLITDNVVLAARDELLNTEGVDDNSK